MKKFLFIFVLCPCLFACKPALPPNVLSESKIESVLYDYHLAQALAETCNGEVDAERYELQQAVFRKHGITEAEFDSSMVYYSSDLEAFNRIYTRLALRLERDAEALGAATTSVDAYASLTAEGDTASVWAGRKVMMIKNRSFENLLSWQQICDSTWLPGDDILWRYIPTMYAKNDYESIYATLVVTYTNDSVRSKTMPISLRTNPEMRIEDSEGWTVRSISGHFYLPVDIDPQHICFFIVTNPTLVRFHKTQEWRNRIMHAKDSLSVDSIISDSLYHQLSTEPVRKDSANHHAISDEHRLSPNEFRELQPVDRKIEIVKEKPYQIHKRQNKSKQKRYNQ